MKSPMKSPMGRPVPTTPIKFPMNSPMKSPMGRPVPTATTSKSSLASKLPENSLEFPKSVSQTNLSENETKKKTISKKRVMINPFQLF